MSNEYFKCFHAGEAVFAAPKITKPVPRHFTRRVFERFSLPVLADNVSIKSKRVKCRRANKAQIERDREQLTPIENAFATLITQKLGKCRLLAICQMFDAGHRQMHLAKMRLQYQGFFPKVYNNRVMQHIIVDSSLASLRPLFCGANCLLLADDASRLSSLTEVLKTVPHLTLLACVVDDRILTPKEVEVFQKLKLPRDFAAQTVGLLREGPATTTRMLHQPMAQLLSFLNSRLQSLTADDQRTAPK